MAHLAVREGSFVRNIDSRTIDDSGFISGACSRRRDNSLMASGHRSWEYIQPEQRTVSYGPFIERGGPGQAIVSKTTSALSRPFLNLPTRMTPFKLYALLLLIPVARCVFGCSSLITDVRHS